MVTALASSADGATLVAGTMRGRCRYYTLVDKRLEYVRAVREGVGGGGFGKVVHGVVAGSRRWRREREG
jgi:hypothetical protein